MGLSLGFLSCSTGLYSVFVPVPFCLDDCSSVVWYEVRKIDSSSSLFLFQDFFGYLESSVSPYKFGVILLLLSYSMKNALGNLIGIALNL